MEGMLFGLDENFWSGGIQESEWRSERNVFKATEDATATLGTPGKSLAMKFLQQSRLEAWLCTKAPWVDTRADGPQIAE